MSRKTDIAYIISHGFAARMLMQTGLLGKLTQKGYKVAVITPDKNDKNLVEYAGKNQIDIFEYNPASVLWTGEYIRLRKYLFEDIRKNPALWEKHLRDIINARQRKSYGALLKIRFYYFLYLLVRTFPFLRKLFEGFERKSLVDPVADKLVNDLDPSLLIATFPVNLSESRLLFAGNRRKGTRTVIHLLSWDNITCKGRFPQLADRYISWGDIMKEEFIEYYDIAADKILNTGVPHFDLHTQVSGSSTYKKIIEQKGLDPELPYLFFAMSSPYFAPFEIDIVEWLAKEIEKGGFGNMQLIIRPHPQNMGGSMSDSNWIKRLESIQSVKVSVDWPKMVASNLNWSMQMGDMLDFAHLIEGCVVSVNSGSTVAIDSLLHDKPVILTLFDAGMQLPWWQSAGRIKEYKHCKKLVDNGGAVIVNNFDEFRETINRFLSDQHNMLQQRQFARYREVGINDGQSTERVVGAIQQILENKN